MASLLRYHYALTLYILKPNNKLAEAKTPDGNRMELFEHDGDFFIRLNGQELMHSLAHASELLLGDIGAEAVAQIEKPRILIGGLGLGFSLRRVLEKVPADATVHVAELMHEVIAWNRDFLSGLNGECLNDPRVKVVATDVRELMGNAVGDPYHAILLDVDNGPTALVQSENNRLYSQRGIRRMLSALTDKGRVAIWSATKNKLFQERLTQAGMRVETVPAKVHANAKRCAYTIYVADKKS